MSPPITQLLNLSGQVAVITGANRGLGRAMAEVFAQTGARLTLMARTADRLEAVAAELRQTHPAGQGEDPTILAIPTDVSEPEQVEAAMQQTMATWGRIDILINNAGVARPGTIDDIDLANWQQILNINLTGAYLCSKAVLPAMKQQRHGRIINISSISGQTGGVSGGAHYAASKGGMLGMTKTLARDLGQYNITVNAITPGQIETDPAKIPPDKRQQLVSQIPLGQLGEPNDIAYATLFLASPMAKYITGATIDVNGGLLKR